MKNNYQEIIAAAAAKYQLPVELIQAIIEQESNWNTYAIRFEENWFLKLSNRDVTFSKTECMQRATSWGLMQCLGETVREMSGGSIKYLSELTDPEVGIDWGCRILRAKIDHHGGDMDGGVLAYNGGGRPEYLTEVRDKMKKYITVFPKT